MKHLFIAGIIALIAFTGCEKCEPDTVIICGEPVGSVVTTIEDDTVNLCALPRTYFISVKSSSSMETAYDTLDWELPVEAFDIRRRDDIQAVVFKVLEGTHTLRVRGASPSIGADWSNWSEWTWTLTRVDWE